VRHEAKENAERRTPNVESRTQSPPIALTIAGSDSSAGAGVQADLKTFAALGVYGLNAVTCIVAETPGKVSRIEAVSADMLREQIEILANNFPIAAMKTGLLYSPENVAVVAEFAGKNAKGIPLVLDPVIIASGGQQLLQPEAIEFYEKQLFPRATLITPNLDEAATLFGEPVKDRPAMEKAGRALAKKYGASILLKGGHLAGDQAIDLLFAGGKITEFAAPFVRGVATHGTGCTYSAAITAGLARDLSLEEAIERAKKFVTECIAHHFRWDEIEALNHSASN
jgi:hydroxymethylpyrimidine/phosphomethylpyrimidine kinase